MKQLKQFNNVQKILMTIMCIIFAALAIMLVMDISNRKTVRAEYERAKSTAEINEYNQKLENAAIIRCAITIDDIDYDVIEYQGNSLLRGAYVDWWLVDAHDEYICDAIMDDNLTIFYRYRPDKAIDLCKLPTGEFDMEESLEDCEWGYANFIDIHGMYNRNDLDYTQYTYRIIYGILALMMSETLLGAALFFVTLAQKQKNTTVNLEK